MYPFIVTGLLRLSPSFLNDVPHGVYRFGVSAQRSAETYIKYMISWHILITPWTQAMYIVLMMVTSVSVTTTWHKTAFEFALKNWQNED